jgi:hypothetical protein
MTWGIQVNLVIVGLYAIAISGLDQKDGVDASLKFQVGIFLCIVGMIVSLVSYFGISAAYRQISYLIDELNLIFCDEENWTTSRYLRPFGERSTTHCVAQWVTRAFPVIIGIFWVVVLVVLLR